MIGLWRIDVATASGSAIIADDPYYYGPHQSIQRQIKFQSLLKRSVVCSPDVDTTSKLR